MAADHTLPVDEFNVATFTYKVIHEQPIFLDLFVPKTLPFGERPVLIRFHGGFLVYGSRNNLQLTPPRILEYALENNLILVSCDYRLIPESNGIEILEDIEDAWSWVQSSLDKAIGTMTNGKSRADLQKVLLTGESAEQLEDNPQLALELPFIWLHHGNDDSEVPIEGSRKFVTKLRELSPKTKLRYTELEGAEHGFWSEISLIQSGEWEDGVKVLNTYL
uniref:Alpha/beta hydrolase fold-3 domain-containing protein n=1 Tax=Fusarium oxysporum (strain Fo5176) TaxID=660025 RepID=A0A0C4DIA8_FUSOF